MESLESTRQRAESVQSTIHEDRIAGKRIFFDDTLQFGAQVDSDATSDENSRCKSCRGQRTEKARDNPSVATGERQEQEGGYSGSTKRQKESPLWCTDGHMSPLNAELEPKLHKYKGSVVLSGDIVKDDSGAYAVYTK